MNDKELIKKIGKEVTDSLVSLYRKKIKSIILYGSYARDDNDEQSDMDIMVLFDCPYEETLNFSDDISEIASEIGLENDIFVSILFRDINSFKYRCNVLPFYQNIVREGQTLYRAN